MVCAISEFRLWGVEDAVGDGVGVDAPEIAAQLRTHCALFELAARPFGCALDDDRLDLGLQPVAPPPLPLAIAGDHGVVPLDRIEELVDALAGCAGGLDAGRPPVGHA